jgi:hypothetical protein
MFFDWIGDGLTGARNMRVIFMQQWQEAESNMSTRGFKTCLIILRHSPSL